MSLEDLKKSVKSSRVMPDKEKKDPTETVVNLSIEDTVVTPSVTMRQEIPMHELLKAQKQIDENNRKLGIEKKPLSRPRSKDKLPLANK